MSFMEYIRAKAVSLWIAGIAGLYMILVSYLCALPLPLMLLILFSGVCVLLLCMLIGWWNVNRRLKMVKGKLEALPEKHLFGETLEKPHDPVELEYYLLMKQISRSAIGAVEQARAEKQDYCDYVESWVHEIKTPLTACSLILANGGDAAKLRRELRRADNLTDTILTYAKLRTVEKDTQIALVDLREVCDTAIREEMELLIAADLASQWMGVLPSIPMPSCWCSFSSNYSSTAPNTVRAVKSRFPWRRGSCALPTTAPESLHTSFLV